ncbi:MAG: EcsC family protein [Tetrasphaera jenkinsii]|jgi:hypothetical protein|nr:EcsC family protein [Tetrasphaera jenkinsii]
MLGFGKDDKDAIADTKTALEAAKGPRAHDGVLGNAGTRVVERLLDAGIDGRGPFDSAAKIAGDALRMHDRGDAAVDAIIKEHTILAAGGGFVTSMGGFITMPVSLPANVLEFYLVATRMVAAIARARGYDINQPEIRSAILLTLVGADADDLLKKAGVVATGRLSNLAAQRLPGPVLMVVNKAVGFRLLSTAGKGVLSRFGKGVPVVGGFVGAGLDVYLLRRIADHARQEFPATR